jgi:hypothetical protein
LNCAGLQTGKPPESRKSRARLSAISRAKQRKIMSFYFAKEESLK